MPAVKDKELGLLPGVRGVRAAVRNGYDPYHVTRLST